jgi:DNA-binding IclR family transcriptional regulator
MLKRVLSCAKGEWPHFEHVEREIWGVLMSRTALTVIKALSLLDEFLDGATEISLRDMAAKTGLNKTTTLRLCASLEEAGFLERAQGTAYRLGPKISQLAQIYRRSFRLEDVVRPQLQHIRKRTGESVSFYVGEGKERVCRFRENSHSIIRHHMEEGARLPLGSGVVGRVLLAFSGKKGRDLDAIRRDGYLIAQGREPHTTSVAVPVVDGRGILHGALVVSGPSIRFDKQAPKRARDLLQDAALKIRDMLPAQQEAHQPQRHRRAPTPSPRWAGTH